MFPKKVKVFPEGTETPLRPAMPSGNWLDDDCDVICDEVTVRRIVPASG
jgi:hypothetical protein